MTWELPTNITHVDDKIKEFHSKYPDKPRRPSLRKLEFPISIIPKHLFRPIPKPDTDPIPNDMLSEAMMLKLA